MIKFHHYRQLERFGIESTIVESLVKRSISYLLAFSSMVRSFKFANFEDQDENTVNIVLKESINGNTLNIVVQIHFLEISRYEATVKTAMCVEDFRVESGQFAVVFDESGIVLRKWINGDLKKICEI